MKTFKIKLLEFKDLTDIGKRKVAIEELQYKIEHEMMDNFDVSVANEPIEVWKERNIKEMIESLEDDCTSFFFSDAEAVPLDVLHELIETKQ